MQEIGYGRKHLAEVFRAELGMTPKAVGLDPPLGKADVYSRFVLASSPDCVKAAFCDTDGNPLAMTEAELNAAPQDLIDCPPLPGAKPDQCGVDPATMGSRACTTDADCGSRSGLRFSVHGR